MRETIWMLTALLIISSCSTAEQKDKSKSGDSGIRVVTEYYPDGKLKSTTEALGKLRHGVSKDYRKDGTLENLISYQSNIKHGPAYTYYSDGKTIKMEMMYQEGLKQGESKWYYQNGTVYRRTQYLNGKITGLRSTYYEDGTLQSELNYKSGQFGNDLREFTPGGRLKVFNSSIIFTEKDMIDTDNRFILQISLSDGGKNVDFYRGNLSEGNYWNEKLSPIITENGIGTIEFYISRGSFKMETINIVAKVKTSLNNYHLIQREYHLAVENKF